MTLTESHTPVRYILDTDSITYQQLGRPAIVQRLAQVNPDEVATTVVTLFEQMRGRLAEITRRQDDQAMQRTFQLLQLTHAYYCRIRVLPFNASASAYYHTLVAQRLRIGTQDLQIASIALAQQATLITSNRRHFDQIPELRVEDWMQ